MSDSATEEDSAEREILYHYTDAGGFAGIVQNLSLIHI